MPTFPLERGENVYKNDADQCPSYCDRILFKNNTTCRARILEYGSLANYWGGDHRPVFMNMRIRTMPQDFISPFTLMDPTRPVQGRDPGSEVGPGSLLVLSGSTTGG